LDIRADRLWTKVFVGTIQAIPDYQEGYWALVWGYVTFRDSGVRCTLGRVSNLYAPIPAVSLGRGTRCNFEGFYELVRIRHPAKQSLNNQKGCFVIASRQTVSYRLTHTIRQQHA